MPVLIRRRAIAVFRAALAAAFLVGVPPLSQMPGMIAYAQDDDDGGSDDDDGGSGGASASPSSGGGSSYSSGNPVKRLFKPKPRRAAAPVRKKQVRSAVKAKRPAARRKAQLGILPVRAANEIIALGLTPDQRAALVLRGYQIAETATVASLGAEMFRLRVPRGTGLEAARADVAALNPTALADFNHYYRTEAGTGCESAHCAAWELISWPAGDSADSQCQTRLKLGMIDTAVNARHEALQGQKLEIIGTPAGAGSSAQHGTAVAALLIGSADSKTPGLLPQASLAAIDPFERVAGDERSSAFSVVKALDTLSGRNVSVINMSLAGPHNALFERLVGRVSGLGVVVVAAAGNGGPDAAPAYPAAFPTVVAVAAVDKAKRIYRRSNQGGHIDFAAPGVAVWTAASVKGGRAKTGTSFAAPFVTAAAALARAADANLSAAQTVDTLAAGALDLGPVGKDPAFGHGLVQAGGDCAAASP